MPRYFLDQSEADLAHWSANFISRAPEVLAAAGLEAGLLTPVGAAKAAWDAARQQSEQAAVAAAAAMQAKQTARKAALAQAAQLVRQLQAHPAVTDAQRALLGLPIRDVVPTITPPPAEAPCATIEAGFRLEHHIHFRASLNRRGKPKGATACEIWRAEAGSAATAADLEAEPSGLRFVMQATRSPARIPYTAADAGKMIRYRLRWINAKGQPGPWSAWLEATVAG